MPRLFVKEFFKLFRSLRAPLSASITSREILTGPRVVILIWGVSGGRFAAEREKKRAAPRKRWDDDDEAKNEFFFFFPQFFFSLPSNLASWALRSLLLFSRHNIMPPATPQSAAEPGLYDALSARLRAEGRAFTDTVFGTRTTTVGASLQRPRKAALRIEPKTYFGEREIVVDGCSATGESERERGREHGRCFIPMTSKRRRQIVLRKKTACRAPVFRSFSSFPVRLQHRSRSLAFVESKRKTIECIPRG